MKQQHHSTHTEIRARPRLPMFGLWLISKTPFALPYPCACKRGCDDEDRTYLCRCAGRLDGHLTPVKCCAHRPALSN